MALSRYDQPQYDIKDVQNQRVNVDFENSKAQIFCALSNLFIAIKSMIHVFLDVHMSLACKISLEPF